MDTTQQTQHGTATRRRMERPTDDRIIAGVASGIAEYAGLSTPFVRLALIVLTIFGGAGILLYIAGWLLIPEEGADLAAAERFLGSLDTTERKVGAGLITLAAVIVLSGTLGPGIVAVAALAGIGYLITQTTHQETKEN